MSLKIEPQSATAGNPPVSFNELLLKKPARLLTNADFKKRFPKLNECDCPLFSRLSHPTYRESMETRLIQQICDKFPDKDTPLTIASVGSGECFQELSILAKLLEAGYSSIQFDLIDNAYEGISSPISIASFQRYIQEELSQQYPKAKVTCNKLTDFDQYMDEIKTDKIAMPSAFLLIDLQGEQFKGKNFIEHSLSLIDSVCYKVPPKNLLCYTSFVSKDRGNLGEGISVVHIFPIRAFRTIKSMRVIMRETTLMNKCFVGHFEISPGKMTYQEVT